MTAELGFSPSSASSIIDGVVDTGRWRQRGITHWHLVREEQPIGSRDRFDSERIRTLVHRAMIDVAHDPRDALTWLVDTWIEGLKNSSAPGVAAGMRGWHDDEAWQFQIEHCWETLAGGSLLTPAGGGMAVRPNLSLDAHCYPMTLARCRAH